MKALVIPFTGVRCVTLRGHASRASVTVAGARRRGLAPVSPALDLA
jgi:hypothetical protein